MKKGICTFAAMFAIAIFGMHRPAHAAGATSLKLDPNMVIIDAVYNGTTIDVQGQIPRDTEAVVKITGWTENLTLKKKERALGVLWMNLGTLKFEDAPNAYMVYLSESISAMARADSPEWKKMGCGFDALHRSIRILPEKSNTDATFGEFLKLKKSEGLYTIQQNAVQYGVPTGSAKPFQATLSVPSSLKPGTYHVEVMAFQDGTLVASAVEDLPVKVTGLPNFLSNLAFRHGTLYGTLAVVIAIIAGLIMGVLFSDSKGAH